MIPRMSIALLALTGSLCIAPAAKANDSTSPRVRLVLPDGTTPQPEQKWIDRAKVPTPAVTVTFRREECPYIPGPDCATDDLQIYMVRSPFWPDFDHGTLLHELGHTFDFTIMTDAARRRFRAIMHDARPVPWRGPPETTPPSENFAEAYGSCAEYGIHIEKDDPNAFALHGRWHSPRYHYYPTRLQHRRVCALIRSL